MTSPSGPVQAFSEKLEYLKVIEGQVSPENFEKSIGAAQRQLESALSGVVNISTSDAVKLLGMLRESPFPQHSRDVLVGVIDAKQSLGRSLAPAGRGGPRPAQTCSMFWAFVPMAMWELIANRMIAYETNLNMVCRFMERLGLVYASESTYVEIASALYLCANPRCQPSSITERDRSVMWSLKEDLKRVVRAFRGRTKLPHHGKILVYPTSPEDLQNTNPDLYDLAYGVGSGNVVPDSSQRCPVDGDMVTLMSGRLAHRKSHSSMNKGGGIRLLQGMRDRDPGTLDPRRGLQFAIGDDIPVEVPTPHGRLAIMNGATPAPAPTAAPMIPAPTAPTTAAPMLPAQTTPAPTAAAPTSEDMGGYINC